MTSKITVTLSLAIAFIFAAGTPIHADAVGIVVVNFSASPATLTAGSPVALTWDSSGMTCTGSGTGPLNSETSGSWVDYPTATKTYTITCSDLEPPITSTTVTKTVTVTIVPPMCTLSANPASIAQGGSSTLSWTMANVTGFSVSNFLISTPTPVPQTIEADCSSLNYQYQDCPLNVPIASVQSISVVQQYSYCNKMSPYDCTPMPGTNYGIVNGNHLWVDKGYRARFSITYLPVATIPASGSSLVTPLVTTTYGLTVIGPGGSAQCQTTVTVTPLLSVSCSASPASVMVGQSTTWAAFPFGGIGSYTYSWSGTDSLSGTSVNVAKSYSTVGTKTGTVTVTSGSQSVSVNCSNSVTATAPVPAVSFVASPASIAPGSSSTLTWASVNATSCVGTNFSTGGLTSGSISVSPSSTKTYTVTCSGPGGSVVAFQTLIVTAPLPTCTLKVSSCSLKGYNKTLSWATSNATAASIDQGVGSVSVPSGSKNISMSSTKTYTMTVSGAGGTGQCSVTVKQ